MSIRRFLTGFKISNIDADIVNAAAFQAEMN